MPTSTKKPANSRKKSQTAKILESIELLLALQEEQSQVRLSEQQDVIIEQLDAVEAKLSKLREIDSIADDSNGGSLNENGFEQLEQRLDEKLKVLADRQAESFENAIQIQLEQMTSAIVEKIEANSTANIAERLDQIESTQAKLADALQKLPDASVSDMVSELKSDQRSLIEQLELITLQLEQIEERGPTSTTDPANLEQVVSELTDSAVERISASVNQSSDQQITADHAFETLTAIQQIDDRLQNLEDSLGSSLPTAKPADDALANQLDQIKEEIAAIKEHSHSYQEVARVLDGFSTISRSDVAEEIQAMSGNVVEELKQAFEARFENGSIISQSPQTPPDIVNPEVAPSDDEDTASHWHKQKRAMLAKYGIDPEYRPLDDSKTASGKKEPAKEPEPEAESNPAKQLGKLHDTIESISPLDNEAVENLKKELNKKLRDAEVELSINRAKLSQQQAELEQKQVELEQKNADLEARLKSAHLNGDESAKKESLMSRFARHLGRKN